MWEDAQLHQPFTAAFPPIDRAEEDWSVGPQVYSNRKDRTISMLHWTSHVKGFSILPRHQ